MGYVKGLYYGVVDAKITPLYGVLGEPSAAINAFPMATLKAGRLKWRTSPIGIPAN